ncbi:MAG: hypothetical protein WA111_04310, partial [Methanothrix sp.]
APLWLVPSIAVHHGGAKMQRICDSSSLILNGEEPNLFLESESQAGFSVQPGKRGITAALAPMPQEPTGLIEG